MCLTSGLTRDRIQQDSFRFTRGGLSLISQTWGSSCSNCLSQKAWYLGTAVSSTVFFFKSLVGQLMLQLIFKVMIGQFRFLKSKLRQLLLSLIFPGNKSWGSSCCNCSLQKVRAGTVCCLLGLISYKVNRARTRKFQIIPKPQNNLRLLHFS